MDFTKQPNRIISLCTGMRGLERGLERAGLDVRTICYVEIETFIMWNLVRQMEEGLLAPAPIWSDLKTFPFGQFYGKVHGIIGGYPCQPFSLAGSRGGANDPRHLWPFIKEGIRATRPLWCFFENVPGHLTLGYDIVRRELQEMGYRVKEGIFSAEEVGATHKRERLYILAILANTDHRSVADIAGGYEKNGSAEGLQQWNKNQEFGIAGELGNTESANEQRDGLCEIFEGRKIGGSGSELADTDSSGSWKGPKQGELRTDGAEQSSGNSWISRQGKGIEGPQRDRWPARPGEAQHEWEAPRTESGMGFTINGHKFRTDLLRMAGNGVVEQTAEIAFILLLQKHRK